MYSLQLSNHIPVNLDDQSCKFSIPNMPEKYQITLTMPNGVILEYENQQAIDKYFEDNPDLRNLNYTVKYHVDNFTNTISIRLIPYPETA